MKNLQQIKSNQIGKYDEIIEYLNQDNGYWLENDKWDMTKGFFFGKTIYLGRFINFENFQNWSLKNELKYYFLYNFKKGLLKYTNLYKLSKSFKHFSIFVNKKRITLRTFLQVEDKEFNEWRNFLIKNEISISDELRQILNVITYFIKDFYDDREEVEKDIWYLKNIIGAKKSGATQSRQTNCLNFNYIPSYYRENVKKYYRTLITKKSFSYCFCILNIINYFFDVFYKNGYIDGFIEKLSRADIEKYLYWINVDHNDKNATYKSKFVSYIRTFLEYTQMAQYNKSPKREISFLIFQDDIPKRERSQDELRRVKFVPEPILKQLDNKIRDLDRPQFIPIYILLRETGWRGTDILNLRYNNCLEQIWNSKEQSYNYYLCGEITKTGIAQLKIPIRDKVAEMVQKSIDKSKELSTEENNHKKYLFNTYEGKLKGTPLNKASLLQTIKRLIEQKDIRDVNGELYHFRLHSLRHTRAKEYVEQGMGISIIQQILGHQSLQMTVHYTTVSENMLYEKWKNTEDLELFKLNTETNEIIEVDTTTVAGKNLIRYEYVKKNLDAVRVPFGVCFKPTKSPCRQQMNHCLNCGSFCTTTENILEYEEEIQKVKTQIEVSNRCGRELWAEKNKGYLELLEKTLVKIKEQKLVHKNGDSREDS